LALERSLFTKTVSKALRINEFSIFRAKAEKNSQGFAIAENSCLLLQKVLWSYSFTNFSSGSIFDFLNHMMVRTKAILKPVTDLDISSHFS